MAQKSLAALAGYQLDPAVRARILSETPLAQSMRVIEQQRQAFMSINDGCPFGAESLDQAKPGQDRQQQ